MHVGVVAKRGNDRAARLAARLDGVLDASVAFDTETAAALGRDGVDPTEMGEFDLVVSIGGDGTFLFTARTTDPAPLLGVNLGEVGFLNAVAPEDAPEVVADTAARIRGGEATYRELTRVQAAGDGIDLPPALNEVSVLGGQRGHGNGLDVEVRLDGETYSETHADGLIVATPTGSTAYNLSEGGPVVHPRADGLIVTEMVVDSGMPSLVVDPDDELSVRVSNAETAYVVADGRSRATLTPPVELTVRRAATPTVTVGPKLDFFTAVEKLE